MPTKYLRTIAVTHKFFLFFLSFLTYNIGISQDITFPTKDAKWLYEKATGDFTGNFETHEFTIGEDSIVNGILYQRIFESLNVSYNVDGLIRSEDNRVYFIPEDSINEVLLYDFNLEIGDTFYVDNNWVITNDDFIIVGNIDSIQSESGYRKEWYLGEFRWIEGIGSDYGFVTRPWYFFSLGNEDESLLCFRENEVNQYDFWCDFYVPIIEDIKNEIQVNVFPNPFTNLITIETNIGEIPSEIQLIDDKGNLIKTEFNKNSILIDQNNPSGLFFLGISTSRGKIYKKIVKK